MHVESYIRSTGAVVKKKMQAKNSGWLRFLARIDNLDSTLKIRGISTFSSRTVEKKLKSPFTKS